MGGSPQHQAADRLANGFQSAATLCKVWPWTQAKPVQEHLQRKE
jgi:hypothetical protein